MPVGKATMAIPITEDIMLTTLPISLTGYRSPYPTVVKVTTAQ